MKAIRILMVVLFSFFGFAATAQTYRIHKANGSVVEYATSDVDSIVFIDAPTTIYYGVGTAIPTSEAEIKQGTPYTTTSSSAILPSINCDDKKAVWVAVPNTWNVTSWKDLDNDENIDVFTEITELGTMGNHYVNVGSYKMYYMLWYGYINNTYTITTSK